MKMKKELWIGIGIGAAAGIGTGYYIGQKANKKKHREEMRKARRKAYLEGVEAGKDREQIDIAYRNGLEDGLEEGKKFIDMYCVVPEEGDTPEQIQEKLKKKQEEIDAAEKTEDKSLMINLPDDAKNGWIKLSDTENAFFKVEDGEVKLLKDFNGKTLTYPTEWFCDENGNAREDTYIQQKLKEHVLDKDILKKIWEYSGWEEDIFEDDSPAPVKIGTAEYDTETHMVMFRARGGYKFMYPACLFIGPDGELLDSVDIRNNIRKHEHNTARLNLIWNQMGWGAYIPDLDSGTGEANEPTDEEINNWDLSLDEDDGRMLGDEPEEKTRERERYLDEVDRYRAHPEEAPRIISRKEFDEECYLEKVYFDYYDVDNKFIENTDVDNVIGPYDYFGITNGNELFRMKGGVDDEDPDIVHVKNFKLNCVIEVTRYHKAYGAIMDGGAYIRDGSADSDGRADGM